MRKANRGNLADDTIAARLTHVQGFFRWAYIHGALSLTPELVKGFIHKPRVKQLSPRDILDASEVGAMLKVAKSAEDLTQARREHALIKVIADAGLRVSEAVNLKADDMVGNEKVKGLSKRSLPLLLSTITWTKGISSRVTESMTLPKRMTVLPVGCSSSMVATNLVATGTVFGAGVGVGPQATRNRATTRKANASAR